MISGVSNINVSGVNPTLTKPSTNTATATKPIQNDKFESSSKKKKTLGIAAGILTVGIGITALIIAKNKKAAAKKIPDDMKALFDSLKGKDGEDFVNTAFNKLKEYMHLEDIAPKEIGRLGADKMMGIQGGYNPVKNTISYTDGFYTKIPKDLQFNLLSHELKHAEQTSKIIRSGMADEYSEAWATSMTMRMFNDPLNIPAQMLKNQEKAKGKELELYEGLINKNKEMVKNEMAVTHEQEFKMPKYIEGSPEFEDAKKYIKATKNYEGVSSLGFASKEYKENPLEVEAYAFGKDMQNKFKTYMNS